MSNAGLFVKYNATKRENKIIVSMNRDNVSKTKT